MQIQTMSFSSAGGRPEGVFVVGRGGGCVGVRGLGVGFEASRGGCVGMRG